MKRSSPLKRTPLRPSLTGLGSSRQQPLRRGGPIKAKGGSRFPKRRDIPFCKWIRTWPCFVEREECWGRVQAAHVGKTRSAGAYDRGEVAPLCQGHHAEQEGRTPRFNARYGINLGKVAAQLKWIYERDIEPRAAVGPPQEDQK